MSVTEFDRYLLAAVAYEVEHPEQRKGQAYWNALAIDHPDVAEAILGDLGPGGRDPFYRDENLRSFLEYVRWGLSSGPPAGNPANDGGVRWV